MFVQEKSESLQHVVSNLANGLNSSRNEYFNLKNDIQETKTINKVILSRLGNIRKLKKMFENFKISRATTGKAFKDTRI